MLRDLGVTLIAADSPSSFFDDGPTSKLIRQMLGAVSEFGQEETKQSPHYRDLPPIDFGED